jgi:hypothetical protein
MQSAESKKGAIVGGEDGTSTTGSQGVGHASAAAPKSEVVAVMQSTEQATLSASKGPRTGSSLSSIDYSKLRSLTNAEIAQFQSRRAKIADKLDEMLSALPEEQKKSYEQSKVAVSPMLSLYICKIH